VLSVVISFYNNRREAANTLYSLTRAYQRGTQNLDYEVIAVDNGSSQPLSEDQTRAYGPEFHYRYVRTTSISPAPALNAACRDARGDRLLVVIDGAHILSPGVLAAASEAFNHFPAPFLATAPFHLGPKQQNHSVLEGYNQQAEDELLQRSGWRQNGYRLYDIAGSFADPGMGWFGCLFESGCFGLRKSDFISLGGFDERFVMRGGGLVNLDLFQRAVTRQDLQYVMLLGEASFHQFHGGVASNAPATQNPWAEFHDEYVRIHGKPFARIPRRPFFFGHLPNEALVATRTSANRGLELWQKAHATGQA
jgi:glycosyltransferase involved in cell wall biosynthesis